MSSGYELKDIRQDNESKKRNDNPPDVVIINPSTPISDKPIDTYHLVFIILLLHGVGSLMPWNMFINANAYFRNYKLSQGNATAELIDTQLLGFQKNFLSYLGFASQVPNVLFNGINLLVNVGSGNLRLRVNLTLAVEALVFALTITLAVIDSSQWPKMFFYITMASVAVLNMASGIYQNCVFGTGAKFPGIYTNAILIGSNLSGTFTSTVDLLSIYFAPEPQRAAVYYFITALVVIIVCLVTYNLLPKVRFYRYHDSGQQEKKNSPIELMSGQQVGEDVPDCLKRTVDAMVPRPIEQVDNSFKGELKRKWEVFLECWPQCINVFFTFYITLALFPAVLANVHQKQNYFSANYYTSFACFFVFNFFAMIGNFISSWTTWPGKDNVWMFVAARILFVPFFLFCNFNPNSRKWPVLIGNDIIFMIGNITLALSSGYLSSVCMMFASRDLKPDDAPKGGMIAAFFLVFGIFLGVNSSFVLTWLVELN